MNCSNVGIGDRMATKRGRTGSGLRRIARSRLRFDVFAIFRRFGRRVIACVRPATVTVVAATLKKAGLNHYPHGHMTILDRKRLEDASCECYGTVRAQFDRLGL